MLANDRRSHGRHLAQDEIDRLYQMIGEGARKPILMEVFNLSSRSVERHFANHKRGFKPTAVVLFRDKATARSYVNHPNCIPSVREKLMRGRA